tara:strand:- start:1042 stop:1812 length:771 start_codon:yes stop_codon:yes gene_type:complete
MILNNKDIKEYKENGFLIIKDYINSSLLDSLRETLIVMFSYNLKNSVKTDRLEELVTKLEKEDHNKVYNIQKTISSSTEVITLLNSLKMGELHSDLYGSDKKKIHLTLFQAPVQFPNDDRFDFKWHQESGSYAGHSNILTCWFPILGPVNKINGSMTLIPRSHKGGLRESVHTKKASGLNDWVINLDKSEEKKTIIIEINPGDLVLFDSNLIHKSIPNISNKIRVTGIVRALDIFKGNQILPLYTDQNLNSKEFTS